MKTFTLTSLRILYSFSKFSFYFFLSILLFGFVQYLSAQSALIKRPELLSGMQKAKINVSLQDRRGIIWFGMDDGLLQYTGVESKIFTRADSLRDKSVTALGEDKNGKIWIGHENGEIAIYNGRSITNFKPKEGVPKQKITKIHVGKKNNFIWFATDSAGLWYYTGSRIFMINEDDGLLNPKSVTKSDTEVEDFANLIPGLETGVNLGKKKIEIYDIFEDNDGKIWVGTDGGVVIIDHNKKGKERFSYISTSEGLPDNLVKKIIGDSKGNIWFALGSKGLCKYNKSTQKFDIQDNWDYGPIITATLFNEQNFWISTEKGELLIFNPENNSIKIVKEVNKLVTSFCEDHQGNLLLGTVSGVFQYYGDRFEFFNQTNGLSSNNVLSVYVDKQGTIWAGTDAGINKLIATPTSELITEVIPIRGPSGKTQITSIRGDHFGKLWIGTLGNGVFRYDPESGNMTNYTSTSGLESNDVNSICIMNNGELIFGTFGGGVSKVILKIDGTPDRIQNLKEFIPELEGGYVYSVICDKKNNLWIGTDGKGLIKFDGNTAKIFTEKEGISARTIYSIDVDPNGNIWMGTSEFGLYSYDGNKFEEFNFQKGLRDESPHSVLCYDDSKIVVGTTYGLDILDPKTKKFNYFGETDGIQDIDPQQNAVFKDKNGVIFMGTTNGILRYNPKATLPRNVGPKVSILKMRIFLKDDIEMVPGLELNYNQNHITFDYIGVSLSAPTKVKYKFKLQGHDDDFSLETQSRVQTYSNLSPGSYSFIVLAENGDGKINVAKYSFVITPPFWKTPWFMTLSLVVLVVGGYTFLKWRVQRVEQKNRALEQKVEERTHEINIQKKIIEEKNNDITESIEYAKRLQYAILPEDTLVKEAFPNSFIYYLPKDIVSGDFYWFNRNANRAFIAAVDCTGHGVPGAFMSIVGYNQLNESFNQPNVTPGKILNVLDKRVRIALKQESEFSVTKDGMDVAMACVDFREKKLIYSGAYRPLFLIRDNECIEYKGERYPIGGTQYKDKFFNDQEIPLIKGDVFYIFSDGYVDQFGGDKGRKYTPKKLRELLLEIHQKPMSEQKKLVENSFKEWLGSYDQMDDVMLIGIKYNG